MTQRQVEIFRNQDWQVEPFKTTERIRHFRNLILGGLSFENELQVRLSLARNLLDGGRSTQAAQELNWIRELGRREGRTLPPDVVSLVRRLLALAHLRIGEQENCLLNHSAESCIYPIRGSGVHTLQDGSRGAIRELHAILEENPRDLLAQWLLNIAYMTLGEHPHLVPKKWLIPASLFESEHDLPRFTDIAPALGLAVTSHAGGSIVEDFEGDGFLDVMVSSSGPLDPLRYFRNNGNGTFAERTHDAGLHGVIGGLNMIHADYNNDGFPDVLVLRGGWGGKLGRYPNSLLRNNGDGTFADVTEDAGVLSFHPTQTAAWADFDNDGWLDLFVGNESAPGDSHPSELYRNNGDGTFTEIAGRVGLADLGYVKGVAWGDYDNDGWPDLYVSRKGAGNLLFRNEGRKATSKRRPGSAPVTWRFTDVSRRASVSEPLHSFAVWFWDYDNDGWLDLFAAGYHAKTLDDIPAFLLGKSHRAEVPRLYRNRGDGTFEDVTRRTRVDRAILVMGANFGDLDNDGYLDCYLGTGTPDFEALLPNRMFRNEGGRVFQDVTTAGGFGHIQKGHGISFADLDNDGDLDVFEQMGGAYEGDAYQSVLYENPGNPHQWLKLRFEGTTSNRSGLGARVRVRVRGPQGTRNIHRTVTTGGSFGDSPLEMHVGLGLADVVEELKVRWPASRRTEVFTGLSPNQRLLIREGDSQPVLRELKTVTFRRGHAHHGNP
jgi:hypothetical protein